MWRRPEQQEKPSWESPRSKSINMHLRAWVALAALLAVLVRGNVTVIVPVMTVLGPLRWCST
jgi:hypothetical protein